MNSELCWSTICAFRLAVLCLVACMPASVRAADSANLSIDQIIEGIEKNQTQWRAQKNWMVRYTHSRERIAPPPGTMVQFPDVELLNARRGKTLAIYHRQPFANGGGTSENWLLWDGASYTERNGLRAYRQEMPAEHVLSYFWYPMTLMRDMISDSIPIPDEAFLHDPELSFTLPHCLKANTKEYTVRRELEDIDGRKCHVLERPGKDVVWISADCGFHVCRRTLYQPSGAILTEFKANGFKEYAPGLWLPQRQLAVAFNNDMDPKEFRGRVRFVMSNNLQEARFENVPDSVFEVPLPAEVTVEDRRKRK